MLSMKRVIELVVILVFLVDLVCGFYEEKEQTKYTTAKLNITICYSERKRCVSIHQEGLFGSQSPIKKASGWLYKLSDSNINGCKIFQVNVDKPWIALVQRGSCRFDDKITNAFRHNATAIIIYDTKESNMPKMLNLRFLSIVSVSITKTHGEELIDMMVMNNETLFVQINVGSPHTKWQVNPTSVLFVSVSFIVLMVISLAWLVFYYVQRFRYVHARDKTEKRLTSAAKKAIAKLSTRTVSKKDEEEEVDSCPVCLDGYKGGETLRILPCQHEFHKMCIDPWLIEHRTCPMCKLNILKELEVPNMDVGRSSVEVEAATVEPPQENEDHQNAADNPVVFIGEIEDSPVVLSRRQSVDGESSGSSDSSARILHVNADINWERDEQTSSTSNLMDSSSLRT